MLISELTKSLRPIWGREEIPKDWCECVVVPIYRIGGILRGISLVNITLKVPTDIILNGLYSARKGCLLENQVGFRPGCACVD